MPAGVALRPATAAVGPSVDVEGRSGARWRRGRRGAHGEQTPRSVGHGAGRRCREARGGHCQTKQAGARGRTGTISKCAVMMAGFAGGVVTKGRAVGVEPDDHMIDRMRSHGRCHRYLRCHLVSVGHALHAMLVRARCRHLGQHEKSYKEEETTNHRQLRNLITTG